MKRVILAFFVITYLAITALFFIQKPSLTDSSVNGDVPDLGYAEELQSRKDWEFNRLKEPGTNSIPAEALRGEKVFAKHLPKSNYLSKSENWVNRGPYNVGGRTRGIAVDITDDNTIIAGGVSGGVWKTADGGQSWTKKTKAEQLHNVTCLAQDSRTGKTSTWYYGTGEILGNSASESYNARFVGDGLFKSTDNGENWEPVLSTYSGTPEIINDWDYIWNIATDPSNDTADVIYVAAYHGIQKSMDGGETWTAINPFSAAQPTYTDVAITSTGIVYTALSEDGVQRGIYRSEDGETFTKILPDEWPVDFTDIGNAYQRIVIAINPGNENEVYFFVNTPNVGMHSNTFFGGEDWNSLWKYSYISGDGTGTGGTWTDLSQNLPAGSSNHFDNLYTQNCYDMTIAISPEDPNLVFLGGTNLYRSTDGFTSPDNTEQIGGYLAGSIDTDWDIWDTHHPDQHKITFLPGDPSTLISATDGGIFKLENCASSSSWERLNNGYITTQPYTVIIDETATNDIIIGGFQDNGNFFTSSSDPTAEWVMPLNGDGSFGYIADNGQNYYLSIQRGKVYKMNIDNNGAALGYERFDPAGANSDNYLFINPFVVDPNDNDIMYLPAGKELWRHNTLSDIALTGSIDPTSDGWFRYNKTLSSYISAIAVSKTPAHRVYYGTNTGIVYRIDDADTGDPVHNVLPVPTGSSAYISCIAIDPRNADNVLVVVANYRTYSLFYTNDGGDTFFKVAGNLEENADGSGNGPSMRWAEIMPFNGETVYLLGTSVGLFATDSLRIDADSTIWYESGNGIIGNVVVEMIETRETDNLIAVATHGNGIFTMHLESKGQVMSVNNRKQQVSCTLYPNTANDVIYLNWNGSDKLTGIAIYNNAGQMVYQRKDVNKANPIDIRRLSRGIYHIKGTLEDRSISKTFIKQ